MSFSNAMENGLLELIFKNTNFANIGDVTGLRGASTAGSVYLSLHTADPGEGGDQTTSECNYTNYARVAVARSGSGWVVTANSASPAANVDFPACGGGSNTATYFGVGTASSGSGVLLGSGAISPSIAISSGVTPRITTASAITID